MWLAIINLAWKRYWLLVQEGILRSYKYFNSFSKYFSFYFHHSCLMQAEHPQKCYFGHLKIMVCVIWLWDRCGQNVFVVRSCQIMLFYWACSQMCPNVKCFLTWSVASRLVFPLTFPRNAVLEIVPSLLLPTVGSFSILFCLSVQALAFF